MKPCAKCRAGITGQAFEFKGVSYHPTCFRCTGQCGKPITTDTQFRMVPAGPVCAQCHAARKAKTESKSSCVRCAKLITSEQKRSGTVVVLGRHKYHRDCYGCFQCGAKFSVKGSAGESAFVVGENPYCETHALLAQQRDFDLPATCPALKEATKMNRPSGSAAGAVGASSKSPRAAIIRIPPPPSAPVAGSAVAAIGESGSARLAPPKDSPEGSSTLGVPGGDGGGDTVSSGTLANRHVPDNAQSTAYDRFGVGRASSQGAAPYDLLQPAPIDETGCYDNMDSAGSTELDYDNHEAGTITPGAGIYSSADTGAD